MPESVRLLERHTALGQVLGIDLYVQRDDLLPFPLAGNKVRKLEAQFHSYKDEIDAIVTNGAIDSNHCRTTAFMAARQDLRCHLVLHGCPAEGHGARPALKLLTALGAEVSIVEPHRIGSAVLEAKANLEAQSLRTAVIPGGCHTPAGSMAYREAGLSVLGSLRPDFVIVASGTGATQGGLAAAAALSPTDTEVVGISVARSTERGVPPVREAAAWAGAPNATVIFLDDYVGYGYGMVNDQTLAAMELGWRHGLPLDGTYTGKAFAGLVDLARTGRFGNGRVLFWHTGGLWNFLDSALRGS